MSSAIPGIKRETLRCIRCMVRNSGKLLMPRAFFGKTELGLKRGSGPRRAQIERHRTKCRGATGLSWRSWKGWATSACSTATRRITWTGEMLTLSEWGNQWILDHKDFRQKTRIFEWSKNSGFSLLSFSANSILLYSNQQTSGLGCFIWFAFLEKSSS